MNDKLLVIPMRVGDALVQVRVRTDPSEVSSSEERVRGHLPASFEDVTNGIEEICKSLGAVLAKVAPTKASVEFNVGISSKTGKLSALFLEGEAEGSLKVSLEWAAPKGTAASGGDK